MLDISEEGAPKFIDEMDKYSYRRNLKILRSKGVLKIRMIIEVYDGRLTSEKQRNLWLSLVSLIVFESGNDRDTINQTFLSNFKKEPEQMNNAEFNALLAHTFATVKEMFDINLTLSKEGIIEQINH